MQDPASARLLIDLDALAANYRFMVREAGAAEVAPVVKADGYGLGAARIARRLWAEGARSFFTARLSEGEALRGALGPDPAIYVLDGCPEGAAARLAGADLTPVLNSLGQVEAWSGYARSQNRSLPAALHIDTGMNRLGLRADEIQDEDFPPALQLDLLVSHLACADESEHPLNGVQKERFAEAARRFPSVRRSFANTAGVFLGEPYHMDQARPGIGLYGGGPGGRPDARLQTVATLLAPILQLREVQPGETVGYGATFSPEAPLRIAVAAAGYADGILRSEGPRGYGWLAGARCPFLGRISMDLIALDVTACPSARAGDEVELLGPNVLLDDAAAAAGTLAYELLVRLGTRAERIYLECGIATSGTDARLASRSPLRSG
jgi:alanine racemase